MLLVLAGRRDAGAAALISRWGEDEALLVSADDLSSPGWVFDPCHPEAGKAVVSGRAVSIREVQGVLVRRPFVLADELTGVAAEDRPFVAVEMTAFLVAWLSGLARLGLPVLNPPTPACLSGPGWGPEHWAAAAAQLGIPVRPVLRREPPHVDVQPSGELTERAASPLEPTKVGQLGKGQVSHPVEVVVVGFQILGPVDSGLGRSALRLARAANTPLLGIVFDRPTGDATFRGASPWPDIGREDVIAALRHLFRRSCNGSARRALRAGARQRQYPPPSFAHGSRQRARPRTAGSGCSSILLWGVPGDRPMAMVHSVLDRRRAPHWFLDQHATLSSSVEMVVGASVRGVLRTGGGSLRLETVAAAYIRPYEGRRVPAVRRSGAEAERHATALDDALVAWADVSPAVVINRPVAMGPNGSKPYQAELIRAAGIEVPETLVTTDPGAALEFVGRHGRVIYKSVSGIRSVVSRFEAEHVSRLGDLSNCPTQLQAFVPGVDVRAHVVGERVFACRIDADEDDYRYPRRGEVRISPFEPNDEVAQRWIQLAASMDLLVAGIDLRLRPDGGWTCFEVNPSPAFSFYQEATGQPIDEAVADLLMRAT